jgi:hypothetical protein
MVVLGDEEVSGYRRGPGTTGFFFTRMKPAVDRYGTPKKLGRLHLGNSRSAGALPYQATRAKRSIGIFERLNRHKLFQNKSLLKARESSGEAG